MNRVKLILTLIVLIVITIAVAGLLISIFERKQEARQTFFKVVDIPENEPDPAVWGQNFPIQYEDYNRTLNTSEFTDYSLYGRYGGSEAFSRPDKYPNYRRLFAGYSFSVDYREDRGHLHALEDMLATQRLAGRKPGTCLTCKSSNVPLIMNELGVERFYATPLNDIMARFSPNHSVSCSDCHDADTLALRISRPAFREAMAQRGIDITQATHQEMRTYVCAQCHAEYYFRGEGNYLVFPWAKGLEIEDIEAYYDELNFTDWVHNETQAPLVKIQHPDYEFWSTGIHARSGVSCADCHMPYKRVGAVKITDHWISTPLIKINNACITCHSFSEEEMGQRVLDSQNITFSLLNRAENALIDAQDAIILAQEKGVSNESLQEARRLHRRAFIRWDFISAENSMGFHSRQEAARILGASIDYARQAEHTALTAIS
ncbi:formate-dependent nitrite reductase, periplasmic cytochrome c552 subunit [Candidatus Methanoperedens nitroreducens]|uniref:nitrite reductase (cytochrome; ammonia-forming) n=1 Tax=Candidatus Methanoperedens nitratireducens TaxID=1392998 RepID=A0A062V5K7_9EURY|nr:ammonia-forming cytochrome c nitrite reductase subunit c552 [Candidatus Methanoperedens nitroreducens]KCZ71079.1 formate-dependent nitrite reductase, periplasmic cytochrome c552 subunit [Candidatus Methanoperedens nitroreducens]MDJ1421548.1 ammonia-forming cytochrome c nitrite reductase subunit c552 [Candidatus Methanoperedens sp.]